MGSLFWAQGKYDEAEPLVREVLEVRRRTLGDEHPYTQKAKQRLESLLSKLKEAETPPTEDSDG